MKLCIEKAKGRMWLALILASSFLIALNFFERFPNGWDQTEYAWCLKQNYLPHSPYILHFLLGKFFYWILRDAAQALSTLSLFCGLTSLVLLYLVTWRLFSFADFKLQRPWSPALLASIATLLMGTNYLFVRQASTQEVYIVQLSFAILSAFLLLDHKHDTTAFGGAVCGCAIATHSASVFLLPSIVFLVLITAARRKKSYLISLGKFFVSTAITVAIFYSIVYFLLYKKPGGDPLNDYFAYIRGIAPMANLSRLRDFSFLFHSLFGLMIRLVSPNIPHGRYPCATFPLGITVFHFLLALPGVVLSWRANWKPTVFWLLWCFPYLCYEILIGNSPDYGVYIVFLLPCLMPFQAFFIVWLMNKAALNVYGRSPIAKSVLVSLICSLLMLPSFIHFARRWDDVNKDAIKHYSAPVLAAAAAAEMLPANSIVIQHRGEWNVNILPYYAERRHVLRQGNRLLILKDLGPFAPMNLSSYELLTTEKLTALIASGKPVYAFEPDPLRNSPRDILDERAFQWENSIPVDLDEVKVRLGIRKDLASRLSGGTFMLYKGSMASLSDFGSI